MAGNLNIAAKLFVGTTVLAAGGTGAYYGTTAVWPDLIPGQASTAAKLEPDDAPKASETPFAASDLDAVASAWAEPEPTGRAIPADSSATARSAEVKAQPVEVAVQPVDRYGLASNGAAPIDPAPAEAGAEEPLPAPAVEVAHEALELASQESTETGAVAHDAAADELSPSPAVARGQEPREEPLAEAVAEPQPLSVSGQETGIASTPRESDDLFAEQPPAVANDRYRRAAAPVREPATLNPFNANPSDAPSEAEREEIEPLPALPHEIGGQLSETQQNGIEELPERTSRSARAARNEAVTEFGGGQPSNSNNSDEANYSDAFVAGSAEQSAMPSGLPQNATGQTATADGTGRPGERALEGLQRPAIEIQKFAPGEIQVGKPAKFVVQLRNVSSQAAEGVIIRDEVPQGTRLISTAPAAETEGGQLLWDLGKLSPGEDRTVEMQLMPMEEGEIGSVATVSYSAQVSVKTHCTMPQLAIRMTAPEKVMVGQEQRVKIELRNPGSGDATGVMLFENVPQNVRHAAGPSLEFEVGTLPAGESRELELVLLAEKAGKTVNVLSARADGNLQVQQQVEFEVIAPALKVDVNGPERRYLERPATYEVSVENPGTAPAHDVQIITKLPKGMQFVRANNLGEYDAATHAVYWSLAELPEGERGTVELVAMPIETGSQTLEVESRTGDGLSDQAQRQIVVDGIAAIMFELRDLEDPIEVGRETTYEIRVVNQGTKAATNVQVAVNLPSGMQLVSAEGETQHKAHRGGILFEPIPQLAPKADTVYRVRVQGTQPGDQRVLVEVNTDDIAQPIRREESTRVFGDE